MLTDNLRDSQIKQLMDRVRDLETRSPLRSSSITSGRLRVGGTATLLIDSDGGLVIDGKLTGGGAFTWTGALTAKGTTRFEGDTTQVGPFHVTGASDFTGTVLINGLTTLLKRLTVTAPGDIRVGGAIPMTIGNATVAFDSGGSVIGYAAGVRMASGGTPDVVVSTGGVSVTGGATQFLTVSSGGHFLGGHKTTTLAANVYLDSASGLLSRVTSAARYKVDPQLMELPDELLSVPVKDWLDREAVECGDPGARVPGVIAEEVEAAGGSAFVTFDEDGQIIGVAYDRFALARTGILARKLDAAMDRITKLEKRLSDLEAASPTGT